MLSVQKSPCWISARIPYLRIEVVYRFSSICIYFLNLPVRVVHFAWWSCCFVYACAENVMMPVYNEDLYDKSNSKYWKSMLCKNVLFAKRDWGVRHFLSLWRPYYIATKNSRSTCLCYKWMVVCLQCYWLDHFLPLKSGEGYFPISHTLNGCIHKSV